MQLHQTQDGGQWADTVIRQLKRQRLVFSS